MTTSKDLAIEERQREIMEAEIIPTPFNPVFKISCHAIGEIMGIKGLGKTGETYIREWFLSKRYKRKKEWYSRFVEKGLRVENIGIEMLSEIEGAELHKNDEYFSNDFMHGSPDVIHDGRVYDIKSSWSIFSYPFFDKEIANKDYWWQLQGYMALTGIEKASLVYCLIDTPQPLIDQELKKLYYQSGGQAEDWTPETYQDLAINYRFDDIPKADRLRKFDIVRDDTAIKQIEDRIIICREYLSGILK